MLDYGAARLCEPLPPSGVTLAIGMTLTADDDRTGEFLLPLQGSGGFPIDFGALDVRATAQANGW
jgi:hypothetical protein